MFDLGMQELIVIFIVALLVFGPKRLPELGRTLGKGINELKKTMSGIKDQIDDEVKEIKDDVRVDSLINKKDLDFLNVDKNLDTDESNAEEKDIKKHDEGNSVNG